MAPTKSEATKTTEKENATNKGGRSGSADSLACNNVKLLEHGAKEEKKKKKNLRHDSKRMSSTRKSSRLNLQRSPSGQTCNNRKEKNIAVEDVLVEREGGNANNHFRRYRTCTVGNRRRSAYCTRSKINHSWHTAVPPEFLWNIFALRQTADYAQMLAGLQWRASFSILKTWSTLRRSVHRSESQQVTEELQLILGLKAKN